MASPSLALTPAWQVRIVAPDGLVAGGGVMVPGNQILTCTHVVNVALRRGGDSTPPGPEEQVGVDVPDNAEYQRSLARVITTTWNSHRDTTLLQLLEAGTGHAHPAARLAARMEEVTADQPRRVRVRGYPGTNPHGLTATGYVVALGGDLLNRAQIDIGLDEPVRFEPGFSGCGVLDPDDGSVIGIMIRARQDAANAGTDGRIGLMEPVEMIEPLAGRLADEELAAVRRVLTALRFPAVALAYQAATAHRLPEPVGFDTAWEAFVRLRRLPPRPDGLPCEVVFLEEIARAGVANSAVLRAYADTRPTCEVPTEVLTALRGEDAPVAPRTATLVVSADPIPEDPDREPRYTLSHWIDDGTAVTNGGSARVTENELPGRVVELIDDTEARLPTWDSPEPLALRLEFILPFSLLTQQIARWRLRAPLEGPGERIGASYEIVVHAKERLDGHAREWGRARRALMSRWRGLVDSEQGTLHRITPEAGARVDAELQDRLTDPRIVVCVLGAHPRAQEGERQLYRALQAGLPAIAWLNAADAESTRRFHASLESITRGGGDIIGHDDVASLPHHLHTWRARSSGTDDGYDPYDITVILDNVSEIRKLFHIGILATPE